MHTVTALRYSIAVLRIESAGLLSHREEKIVIRRVVGRIDDYFVVRRLAAERRGRIDFPHGAHQSGYGPRAGTACVAGWICLITSSHTLDQHVVGGAALEGKE